VAWFAILFTGRYPRGLFDYVVGVGRWVLRVQACAFLLVTDRSRRSASDEWTRVEVEPTERHNEGDHQLARRGAADPRPAASTLGRVNEKASTGDEQVRAAEVIAVCCLATDLGMGFPFEHGLHATLMAQRLADLLGVDSETESHVYYCSLLMYTGCTTDADIALRVFAGDRTASITPVQFGSAAQMLGGFVRALPPPDLPPHRRLYEIGRRLPMAVRFFKPHFAALCDVAETMAERLGLPPAVQRLFVYLTERWDGKGVLGRAAGDEIPLPIRIASVARDAAYQRLVAGDDHAVEVIRERAGKAFDPEIADAFANQAADVLAAADNPESAWGATLAAEPKPWLTLKGEEIDRALAGMGDFADLVSPFQAGHSTGVAKLAVSAAERSGLDPADVQRLRRAAHLHDLGRVGIGARIWQKPGVLSAGEWEDVRLHTYHTGRVLSRSPMLATLVEIACAHHERLDGSGYHREVTAASLPIPARLLAAADAFHAMTEPRPHRAALSPEEAAEELGREAGAGWLDPDMVRAVVQAAGQPAPRVERPAGLTEREAETLGLLARGLQTKQIARALDISVKTADGHIQNAYRKIGVSSRAAATLFAMEHGLVSWGELERSRPAGL
jgi:HD-GYP domain-containing protein (c-di-GMP phosphodiesterase class II)